MTESADLAKAGAVAAMGRVIALLNSEDPHVILSAARLILSEGHRAVAEETLDIRLQEVEKILGIRPAPLRAAEPEDREAS